MIQFIEILCTDGDTSRVPIDNISFICNTKMDKTEYIKLVNTNVIKNDPLVCENSLENLMNAIKEEQEIPNEELPYVTKIYLKRPVQGYYFTTFSEMKDIMDTILMAQE